MIIHNEKLLENFYKHDKLNIAILTDIYLPFVGGVSMVTDKLASSLSKTNKVNVVLITGVVKGYTDSVDYPVIRTNSISIPKAWGNSLPLPNLDGKFKKLLKSLKIDILHIHTIFGICKFGLKYSRKNNIPAIMHIHSKFSEEFPTIIKFKPICSLFVKNKYKLIDKASHIITVSNNTKSNLLAHNIKTPIDVLPNATDMTKCSDKEKAFSYIYEKHNIKPDEENIFLNVSRLDIKCKNLDFLLYSLKQLKELGKNFKLIMVGGGPDENKFKNLAKELGLDNNIILTGNISDREILKYYFLRADLFVFPSTIDTCAIVKFEAASQNTPTLAIENTGASEGITNNVNGFIAKNNVNEYSAKINEIISNKNKLEEVSKNCYETLYENWDNAALKCVEIYEKILENKK